VDGIHDLGGMQGFGAVRVPGSDAPIHGEWELRCFVLNMMASYGGFGGGPFRFVIESLPAGEYLRLSYYEKWLHLLETRLIDNGTLAAADLDRWRTALAEGAPVPVRNDARLAAELPDALRTVYEHGAVSGSRHHSGDRVRVRRMHPAGHTRCPRYVRGCAGVVERVHGLEPPQDRPGLPAEPYYAVRFTAEELWGPASEPVVSIIVDLWESYLEGA
jgi:nitrile hydratase beta subunit